MKILPQVDVEILNSDQNIKITALQNRFNVCIKRYRNTFYIIGKDEKNSLNNAIGELTKLFEIKETLQIKD